MNRMHHRRRPLRLERLESRRLLTAVVMSDLEQLLIELVNRARANPEAEASRYGIALNEGLPPGTISPAPKQPLAPNQLLAGTAEEHSRDMLDRDFFAHDNPDGQSPFDRMEQAGYRYRTAGENISWTGTTGTLDREASIYSQHEGLFESPGHRQNILAPAFRELGTGIEFGVFTFDRNYNASMVTENFGARSGNPFITGVVYDDVVVDDDFYTVGEGLGSATITAVEASSGTQFVTQSGPSGGYALQIPAGTYTVTANGGELDRPIVVSRVVVGAENQKVDFDASLPPETFPWHNPDAPLDVNDDGLITPLDPLIVINYINRNDTNSLPAAPSTPPPYLDVTGDGWVGPLDALRVINYLNRQSAVGNQAAPLLHSQGEEVSADGEPAPADLEAMLASFAEDVTRFRLQRAGVSLR